MDGGIRVYVFQYSLILPCSACGFFTDLNPDGQGTGPRTPSHRFQACHISPRETGFLRFLTCGQLHFVRHVFLTLPRENSCHCRCRLRQTPLLPLKIHGACESTKLEAGLFRVAAFSKEERNFLSQEPRKWCYCELVLTLCLSKF